jgi:membrane associated rhomboid family serine protease
MILVPLKHENMKGRRWPIITFILIGLNVLAFLGTHWVMLAQQPELGEVRLHVLLLAAAHPDLNMSQEVQEFVSEVQKTRPELWAEAGASSRSPVDSWEASTRSTEDPQELQAQMDSLGERFHETMEHSLVMNYALVPAHPKAIAYLTANFLHGGWLHLIGNMWFLWLAGFILEETWGRVIYTTFYLVSGIVALQIHASAFPDSMIPTLGASGAIAALMGGFLVRFPKLKIDMWGTIFLYRFRFQAPAYSLLPLWLIMEIYSGAALGQSSGVAHWAHVGGFVFGALAALGIQRSGLEQRANEAIEAKVGWTADPAIVQATDLNEQGKFDDAIVVLKKYIATKPDSIDAYSLLQKLYWRKNDIPSHFEMSIKLCQLYLKAKDEEAALLGFQEFQNMGGKNMPASTWLEFCRIFEGRQNYERAVAEYDHLAKAWPSEKQSLLALMAAGRLSLKNLNRPFAAVGFYKAAAASGVPHLEWDSNIQNGIEQAEKALSVTAGSKESANPS